MFGEMDNNLLLNKFDNLTLDSTEVVEEVTFFVVGMKYVCHFDNIHRFSENDNIRLEKENDNIHDANAIKVLVEDSAKKYRHVAYVAREDAKKLRKIVDFEKYKIKFVRGFAASAELTLLKKEIGLSSSNMKLLVQRKHPEAKLPSRGSSLAAGYDLYSIETTVVPAKSKAVVSTGISICVPEGTYGRIAPRSGLAVKHSIDVGAGVIDPDYRGTIFVALFNHSDEDFKINKHDRIAQLLLECILNPEVIEVESLEKTERDENGFGSTGC